MDTVLWFIGIVVVVLAIVVISRYRARSGPPAEDPSSEREATENARRDHARGTSDTGLGSSPDF